MRVVKEYTITFKNNKFETFEIELPNTHQLLSVKPRWDGADIYFFVDPNAKLTKRTVAVVFTDAPVPDDFLSGFQFVSTHRFAHGMAYHVWENVP